MTSVLVDWEIRNRKMLTPFVEESPRGEISSGLSSMGYDLRLGYDFIRYKRGYAFLDPKNINPEQVDYLVYREPFLLEPYQSILGTSIEHIEMPDDLIAIANGKSTLARCFLLVYVTPIEPGYKGKITLELTNNCPVPLKIYPGEGICQLMFLEAQDLPEKTYATKDGIYQNQTTVTLPRVRKLE